MNLFHRQPIITMTISLTGASLLVGTDDGIINIYDILSHQLLRTISSHKGMSITYLKTMIKPVDLVGHISLSLNVGTRLDTKDIIPVRPVAPFQRMKDAKIRDAHEVTMMLPVQEEARTRFHRLLHQGSDVACIIGLTLLRIFTRGTSKRLFILRSARGSRVLWSVSPVPSNRIRE